MAVWAVLLVVVALIVLLAPPWRRARPSGRTPHPPRQAPAMAATAPSKRVIIAGAGLHGGAFWPLDARQ